VELAVEIGRTRMTIGQTLELRPGSVVSLNRLAGEPVDLLINGKPIARGEVVVIDEEFGLRVTDVVSSSRGTIEDEVEALGAEPEFVDVVDAFAGASLDDLPMGGLPTPGDVS
jgi:flagellar motor switch protein FliN